MTIDEAKALKVGDMIRCRDLENNWDTIEIVIEKWHNISKEDIESIFSSEGASLQTVAVISEGDDDEEYRAKVGDEGWLNAFNCENFERIA
jgi:hypothetical protein